MDCSSAKLKALFNLIEACELDPKTLWPIYKRFYAEVIEANQRLNLTRITEADAFCVRHLMDSLAVLSVFPDTERMHITDLGTGGGFPGMPLWIAQPQWQYSLLDSVKKKLTAVKSIARTLQDDFPEHFPRLPRVLHGRAEDFGQAPGYRHGSDIVVSRAVGRLNILLEYALPLVKKEGLFIAMKGPSFQEEVDEIEGVAELLGGHLVDVVEYNLPDEPPYVFVVFEKLKNTPPRYPRAAGIPKKSPL